jgi:DNA modification methylase
MALNVKTMDESADLPPARLDLASFVPDAVGALENPQLDLPRIAKDIQLTNKIDWAIQRVPTHHRLFQHDARSIDFIKPGSVHLVLTSPPYWTLKEYRDSEGQMGHIHDYKQFIEELDRVWASCFQALVPGGRLVCVVGDVCLSRKKNGGRHSVVPLHATIQEHCREVGFDNLTPIIWHKIANAVYEVEGGGGGFLGKPFEPNSVIKNDIEFILMQRKPGGYRTPTVAERVLSVIAAENHKKWFQQIWTGLQGASTRAHPAPYPLELAERLIRMFSFVGDTILDPFMGTSTTNVAAAKWGRNSIGVEVDPTYFDMAHQRFCRETSSLFGTATVETIRSGAEHP